MNNTNNIPTILETIILKPLLVTNPNVWFSAATGIYTPLIRPFTGSSQIALNPTSIDIAGNFTASGNISGGTFYANAYYSGGTNLLDIFNSGAGGTELTGGTLNNTILSLFNSNNSIVVVTGFTDYYTTGATFNPSNRIGTFTRNDGSTYNLNLSALTATTVNITGGTYSGGTIIFTNSTGGTFQVTGLISANTFTTGFTYSSNTFTISDNEGHIYSAIVNTMTGLTINGNLSASTLLTPVKIQTLSATTADTSVVSVDTNGILHKFPISGLTGTQASNNFALLTNNYDNSVYQPHGTIAVKDKFYVGSIQNTTGYTRIVCYNDPNDLTNKTDVVPYAANLGVFAAMCYSTTNDRIYTMGTSLQGSGFGFLNQVLITINPNTNTYTTHEFTTGITTSDINAYGIDTDDTYVYVGGASNKLFRIKLSDFSVTSVTLTGGNLIHDVRFVQYSDGAEIICTSSSLSFPIFTVNPADLSFNSLAISGALWTDDMALIKNTGNTVANGCTFWLGSELGGPCAKYQSVNRVLSATSEKVYSSLLSYGLFTDGLLVYNMSKQGYIEVWPYNLPDGAPITTGIRYLVGNSLFGGVKVWQPNELLISNSGKMFFTNYASAGSPTDGSIYQFFLTPAPIGNPVNNAVTAVTITNNILSVTKNNFSATTTIINTVTGGTYSNGTITLSGSGTLSSITGLPTTITATTITSTTLTNNILNVIQTNGILTATTINAVTGGSFSNGTITFSGSGSLSTITGLTSSNTTAITGFTLVNNIANATLTNSTITASTINAVTGGTFSAGTITLVGSGILGTITGLTSSTSSVNNTDGTITVTTGGTLYTTSLNLNNLNTWTGLQSFNVNNLTGATTFSAVTLVNNTAATSGVTAQNSPSAVWSSSAWKSNAVAASQNLSFQAFVQATGGAGAIGGFWLLQKNNNNTGYLTVLTIFDNAFAHVMTSAGFITNGLGLGNLTPSAGNIAHQPGAQITTASAATTSPIFRINSNGVTPVSGNPMSITQEAVFAPTGGSATYAGLGIIHTINQVTGATGTTRGIYINPTISAATNYRGIEIDLGSLSATTRQGLYLVNSSGATTATSQNSPTFSLEGQGFKTNATAGSQSVVFSVTNAPVQGTAAPTGNLNITSSINGAAATTNLVINSAAGATFFASGFLGLGVGGGLNLSANAVTNPNEIWFSTGAGIRTRTTPAGVGANNIIVSADAAATWTSGNGKLLLVTGGFSPASGNANCASLVIEGIINQATGATGVTRGIWVSPALSAASDYRGIEVNLGSLSANTKIGLALVNSSAATSANTTQYTPLIRFEGQGFATGGSQSVVANVYLTPYSGVTNPSGRLIFENSISGAPAITALTIDFGGSVISAGTFDITTTTKFNATGNGSATTPAYRLGNNAGMYSPAVNNVALAGGGSNQLQVGSTQAILGDWGAGITWTFGPRTAGNANNRDGMNLIIQGGQSSGNQNGGFIKFQTSPSGATGSTVNTMVDRMLIDSTGQVTISGKTVLNALSGNTLVGSGSTDDGINNLQVSGSVKSQQYRLSGLNAAPASSGDTGTLGEIRITSGFIYVCISTNTWVRATLNSF